MILCVTPNPAIDRTLHVSSLYVGEVHRADKTLIAAGGKGLNVARTIKALGGEPFCMGLIGGHSGNLFADLAEQEGLPAYWTHTRNETRTCMIFVEDGKDATVVNERGAEVSAADCEAFVNDVWQQAERVQFVCVSGSLPPGFSQDSFHSLLSGLVEQKKSVWVDTSGTALRVALDVKGIHIKVNAEELGDAVGMEISDAEQAVKISSQLQRQGVNSIAITLGKNGAVLSSRNGNWSAKPPKIKAISSVGSGDAFLGGLVFGLASGYSQPAALQYGVAAGAANALHFGGGIVRQEEFSKIYENVTISFLP